MKLRNICTYTSSYTRLHTCVSLFNIKSHLLKYRTHSTTSYRDCTTIFPEVVQNIKCISLPNIVSSNRGGTSFSAETVNNS